jgi:DNA polymerase beta
MKGGHKGPCALNKKTNQCKKSSFGDSQCEVSDKGACKKKPSVNTSIPTPTIGGFIQQLDIIIKYYEINPDGQKAVHFKIRQYNKMISILKTYPSNEITDIGALKEHFIKNGIKNPKTAIEKATAYKDTGKIPLAEKALLVPQINSVINLTKVYGIGPKNAIKLFNAHGISDISELKTKYELDPSIINAKQAIGLKYFDDLETRIPRKEMNSYKKKLEEIVKKIPGLVMSINGSYRRGAKSSGDLDLLITSSDSSKNPEELRKKLISQLQDKGLVIGVLATGKVKFMGIAKLTKRSKARHIDIIHTTMDKYPFAQLYFTGSGGLNIQMRTLALTQGYSLNEYTISHKTTKKPVESTLINSKIGKDSFETEKDIFDFLGMEYLEPDQRNIVTAGKLE